MRAMHRILLIAAVCLGWLVVPSEAGLFRKNKKPPARARYGVTKQQQRQRVEKQRRVNEKALSRMPEVRGKQSAAN